MQVALLAVPYDSGHRGLRMGTGPEHLVTGGLPERLERAGHAVYPGVIEASARSWQSEIGTTFELTRRTAEAVARSVAEGRFPMVLSGNCGPAAIGTVAGLGAPAGVFWFDAHGDFNTPEITTGGFLDGMALATLTGRCWAQLAAAVPGFRMVPDHQVVLIGARDLDPLEAAAVDASKLRRVPAPASSELLTEAAAAIRADVSAAYVHVDLDVLDTSEGRVNVYSVANGLRLDDLLEAVTAIGRVLPIVGAAMTAYDPSFDSEGRVRAAALRIGVELANAAAAHRR